MTLPAAAEDYEWIGNYLDDANLIPDSVPYWSFFEGGFWNGLKVPGIEYSFDPDGNDDDALLGTAYDTDPPHVGGPWHLSRGGTLYFGDFTHRLNSAISPYAYYAARDLENRSLDVQSGRWTFDFGSFTDGSGLLSVDDPPGRGSYRLTDFLFVGDKVKHSPTGAPGNAELRLRNGTLTAGRAALAVYPGAEGSLGVAGPDASLIVRDEAGFGNLHVGDSGAGRLSVTAGAFVDVSGQTVLGHRPNSSGTVAISGAGSTLHSSHGIVVGGSGRGSMRVTGGGAVTSGGAFNFIGIENGAVGEVTVTGPDSTWTDMFRLTIGGVYHTDTAGQGKLTVAKGGQVVSQQASVGNRSRSRGEVTVTGTDSTWQAGHLMLGDDGRGSLLVEQGGRVTTSRADIGHTANGIGDATVMWRGRLDADTDVIVGNEGRGTLAVGQHGVVNVGRMLRVGLESEISVQRGRRGGIVNVGEGAPPAPGFLRVGPGGVLGGKGVINADVVIVGGEVSPGQSPGVLTINGDFLQNAGSVLTMEIAGTTPGVQYDQLFVTGDLTLDGDVNVQFLDGFIPMRGDVFELFAGSATTFSGRLNVLGAPANLQFASSISGGGLSLTVVPEPPTVALGLIGLLVTLAGCRRGVFCVRLKGALVRFLLLAVSSAATIAANNAAAGTMSAPSPWPQYSVIPVLFSPTDWDVNSEEVQSEAAAIRSAMQDIQQFYANSLGGRTFRLNELEVVQGYGAKG